ncbi:MAG: cupin domain-containing protein [Candidatus Tectomicrobia bacterium]|nr:cupin domain-containing protein [Candidatus Tectomicrobia bacterium]MBI2133030.1 cupin domain-containing protein [Candidatus Tectomicrobia bacterium]
MHVYSLTKEAQFRPERHVEKVLGRFETQYGKVDVTVACWEPGHVSPNHAHPHATEVYFCFSGGGTMKVPGQTAAVRPGEFIVHPPGELHEYTNGPERTLLFRVRAGDNMASRTKEWPTNKEWKAKPEDAEYYKGK